MAKKKRRHPNVNTYDAELMFERLVEQAVNLDYINKPISWALYETWKWANVNEEVQNDKKQ